MSEDALQHLPVDLAELCIALETEAGELRWYLDVTTGDVILVSREYEAQDYGGLSAEEIEGSPERFLLVPAGDASTLVGDMESYAASLSDARLQESLSLALSAPRPERRFRAVLGWLPEEQERWHRWRQERAFTRAQAWLSALGLRAVDRRPKS